MEGRQEAHRAGTLESNKKKTQRLEIVHARHRPLPTGRDARRHLATGLGGGTGRGELTAPNAQCLVERPLFSPPPTSEPGSAPTQPRMWTPITPHGCFGHGLWPIHDSTWVFHDMKKRISNCRPPPPPVLISQSSYCLVLVASCRQPQAARPVTLC